MQYLNWQAVEGLPARSGNKAIKDGRFIGTGAFSQGCSGRISRVELFIGIQLQILGELLSVVVLSMAD